MILSFEGFSLGILFIRWGSLLIALGAFACSLLFVYEAKRRREDVELLYHLSFPLVVGSAIGARLWYIFTPPLSSIQLGLTTQYYLSHFLDSLTLWLGGYGIPGAWIGGSVALVFVARQNDIPFPDLADLFAPGLALFHAIGRLSNYFNQELYGLPTQLPWKIFIAPEHRLAGFEAAEYYHPLFAYESILSFALFILLMRLASQFPKSGNLFFIYLLGYSTIRFLLEFLRLDVSLINGFNVNQIFFAVIWVISCTCLYWINRSVKL